MGRHHKRFDSFIKNIIEGKVEEKQEEGHE